ncbi:bifunctional diguanylate cyclase/phosphodiesterase [Aliidiomarina sedimenti]|uniref:Bifunctional diguanylate cyclase/phosphodiesterase n=1 Tax=Aliidiomarina sedimenti TaxID=1933879 RepID=A0ABY0BZR3_9GAMM|nr:EAL domain-containing protein [Aliidiomarina sedimenti]RUO30574.1 bifunctional diguanylate cyclase/phosphodiesterase [Aliidiomarina sedimenti]
MVAMRRWFILFLVVSFAVLQGILIALLNSYQTQQANNERIAAFQQLATLRAQFDGLLNANLASMRGLRAEFMANPAIDEQRFATLNQYLLADDLHTRHVAVAPDLVIRYVYPRNGNEQVLGTDYRELPTQMESVRQAIESGDIVFQGPVPLLQGGEALIARVPLVHDDNNWGIISQVLDHQRLFADAGIGHGDSLNTALRAGDDHLAGDEQIWNHDVVELPIQLGVLQWSLAGYPTYGYWAPPWWHYWPLLLAGNLVIAAILALFIVVFINHRRLQHAFSQITEQAQRDPLTGLVNRVYLRQLLGRYIDYCETHQVKFCVLFIDLDHFKQVNDSLGHDLGDQLLITIAERLSNRLRERDIVARIGGDEFILVLKDVDDLETCMNLANQLQQTLTQPVELDGHHIHMHASIGIAMYPEDGEDVMTLIKHADVAMYSAKSAGRNTSAFFDASMQRSAESQLKLSEEMRTGLNSGQFVIYYQPIVTPVGAITHLEALVRWQHPALGLLSPAQFIPCAERNGIIALIGDFVLTRVCSDLASLRALIPDVKVSINRSPAEFNDPQVASRWLAIMTEYQVASRDVIFEITESMLMPDQPRQHALINQLDEAGIQLAIDDFGTGYSSVNYVRRFPIRLIKVDRSFTQHLAEDRRVVAMVGALVQMAKALDVQVVAEGVETQAQAQMLETLGVDYLQGYLYTEPLPRNQLAKWYPDYAARLSARGIAQIK